MTRIRFTRTGGFANLRLRTEVDDPAEVARILDGLRGLAPAAPGAARDDFTYEFEVLDQEGERPTGVSVPASRLPAPLRAVTRDLVARARPAP